MRGVPPPFSALGSTIAGFTLSGQTAHAMALGDDHGQHAPPPGEHEPPPSEKPHDPAGQPAQPGPPSGGLGAPPMDTPREPDVSSCVNAFLAAREWVSMMKAPATSDEASAISLPGVRGIAVMLRFEGRVIGGGEDWPGGVGDDRMLRRAVARAIAEAMGDDLIRNLDPVLRESSGQRLSIEIDFAGRPEPLLGRTFDDCASRIDRGLDGIALRRGYPGSISWHVAFPSHLIASNTARSPRGTIERLVRESGLPPKDLDELSRIEPIGIFRFVSFRLAQSSPTAPPQPRGRGVSRVIDGEVTRASVVSHAMGILRRFSRALPPEEGNEAMPKGIGVFGNYSPVRDSYEPLIAPPQDQAFVAWAAAAVAVSPSFTDADRAEARALCLRVLRDFIETHRESPARHRAGDGRGRQRDRTAHPDSRPRWDAAARGSARDRPTRSREAHRTADARQQHQRTSARLAGRGHDRGNGATHGARRRASQAPRLAVGTAQR